MSYTAESLVPSSTVTASINYSASSTTIAFANPSRLGFVIYNDSDVPLRIKYGTTASSTDFTIEILPKQAYERLEKYNVWKGRIDGIWDAAGSGKAMVTEII